MTGSKVFWLLVVAFGTWLAIHCPRAALKEYRMGVAIGVDATGSRAKGYRRANQPIGFWVTIILTAAAGVLGLLFALFGFAMVLWGTEGSSDA